MSISNNLIRFKVEGKIEGGQDGNYRVSIKCPHCGETHVHECVSSGDVRMCQKRGVQYRYKILLLPTSKLTARGRIIENSIQVKCPICQEIHTHGIADNNPPGGIRVAHCLAGSYNIIVGGGKK